MGSMPAGSYIYLPMDRVVYGPGSLSVLPGEVDRLGGLRVLLVTTGSIVRSSSLAIQVQALLGERCVAVHSNVRQHTPAGDVTGVCNRLVATEADLVVSLGGGSVIDAAKAAILANARETGGFLPHIAIPTTLSASEFSPLFGVTDEVTRVKGGGNNAFVTPRVAILDAEVTQPTPRRLWLGSGIRALDHAVETVYAPDHGPVSDATALEAIRLLFTYLPRSVDPADVGAAQQCQLAAWLSFFGVANITLGLSHVLGRQLGPRYGVAHGDTSAVMLPHVMDALVATNADRLALVAVAAGAAEHGMPPEVAAREAPRAVRELVALLDLPCRLRDLGVPEDDLEALGGGQTEIRAIVQAAW